MRKILDDKWTTKAKPALERDILQRYNMSNEKDIIFALYLYCAYNSMTEETRGFLAKRIDANGNVIKHEATDVEKDNSMMPILFGTKGNLGFLGVYMKFRNAFKICSGQATVQQAMASSKPEPNKTVATTNDTIVLRNRIANDAYEYVKDNSAKFKSANKSGKTGNIYTNDVDCSLFVSNVCKGVLAGLTNNLDTSAESKDPLFLALKKMGGVTRSTSAVMAANSKETPNPRPGDFVFFLDNGVVHHVEIYYGEQSKDGKIVQMSIGTSDKKDAVLLRDINRPPRVTKIHSFF
jgi:hypothetical protein